MQSLLRHIAAGTPWFYFSSESPDSLFDQRINFAVFVETNTAKLTKSQFRLDKHFTELKKKIISITLLLGKCAFTRVIYLVVVRNPSSKIILHECNQMNHQPVLMSYC